MDEPMEMVISALIDSDKVHSSHRALLGVYFAKDGTISMTQYARSTAARWSGTRLNLISCAALAELVNLPSKFRSMNPYFVVTQTEWIIWFVHYLLPLFFIFILGSFSIVVATFS